MPKAADVNWDKVQEERNAGATTTALAEKYGVRTPTICAHTKSSKKRMKSHDTYPPQHARFLHIGEALTARNLPA